MPLRMVIATYCNRLNVSRETFTQGEYHSVGWSGYHLRVITRKGFLVWCAYPVNERPPERVASVVRARACESLRPPPLWVTLIIPFMHFFA